MTESQSIVESYLSYIRAGDNSSGTEFSVHDDRVYIYQELDDEDEPDKYIVLKSDVTPQAWADLMQHIDSFAVIAPKPHTYSDELYSDLHKDALGTRPGEVGSKLWNAMAPDEKQAHWDYLVRELERSIEQDVMDQQRNIAAFEARVTKMMDLGAHSRDQAISWLMEADDWNGDLGQFCYDNGLPYNYFSVVHKPR